jgi:nitroreductase
MNSPEITDSVDTILSAIRGRRSFPLNQLSPEPIDLDAVRLMLEAANWAPSHGQTEPWRFTVFAGEGRQGLSDAFGIAYRLLNPGQPAGSQGEMAQRNRVWQAPVWVSIGMLPALNERGEPRMPEWEEMVSAGVAAHNAHLVASSMGLGAKWTSGDVVRHPHVVELVGLEPRAKLLGFLYIGRPAIAWPQGTRRPIEDKVRWVTAAPEASADARL